MIKNITRAYIRHYTDNNQTAAYVEWVDHKGQSGRTEGQENNPHMLALLARADTEGITVERQQW